MSDELPARDHNRPPDPLFLRTDELIANCNRWIRERPVITDDEQAGAAQDFQTQLRQFRDALEEQRDAERKPHDDAVAAIRVRYRTPLELVGIALTKMGGLLTPFLTAKDARLKAEAARQQREAEALMEQVERALDRASRTGTVEDELAVRHAAEEAEAAKKAAAKGPARAQVKGDYSARAASLISRWSAEIVDEAKAIEHFANNPEVRAATLAEIARLASRLARQWKDASRAPPGCRFVRKEQAR